jgi:hypothetical protein
MGLKGDEGVAAYLENEAKLGAAKFGVKYSGADPALAQQNMIATALAKRGDYDDANSTIVRLEKKEKLSASEQAMLDKSYASKRRIEAEVKAQYPNKAPSAGGATNTSGAGAPTLAEFMAAARAAPQNRGISDEQLAAHYNRTYGGR